MDTWVLLREMEPLRHSDTLEPQQRAIHLLKSRGMAHSRKMEPFEITDHGIVMTGLPTDIHNGSQRRGSSKTRQRKSK
jgi:hypothetical protein